MIGRTSFHPILGYASGPEIVGWRNLSDLKLKLNWLLKFKFKNKFHSIFYSTKN